MNRAAELMTDEEIQQAGLDALARELGPIGMVRFLQLLRPSIGDYTAERHTWLKGLTIDDLIRGIRQEREQPEQDSA